MGINKTVDIEKILEAISLEFVLADNADPESFSNILPLLKELFETAKKQNLPEIAEESLRAGKILKIFLNNSVSASTEKIDSLGNIISEMQSFVNMFSDSLNQTKEIPGSAVNDIIHPAGELPSCLNMDDFSEFLDAQTQNLEQMESLILDIEKNKNTNDFFSELKGFLHTMKGESGFLNLKDVENICHRTEDLIENNASKEIVDILLTVKDWLQSTFAVYSGQKMDPPQDINKIISLFKRFNAATIRTKPCLEQESYQYTTSANPLPPASPVTIKESTNVDTCRLDRMIDTIGEFAIAESMVFQSTEIKQFASPKLMRSINQLHKITRELQNIGISLRMIPLKSLFYKMERVVRDLSKKTKKKN